jgi:hypothetical protein
MVLGHLSRKYRAIRLCVGAKGRAEMYMCGALSAIGFLKAQTKAAASSKNPKKALSFAG